jgi:putative sterol carrier protein
MNCKEFFSHVEENLKPEAAVGVNAVYQFRIDGDGGGAWNATIRDGTCTVREGTVDSPDCTVATDVETWMAMVGKSLNPMDAFMKGRLRIKGEMDLAMRLEAMFLK